MHLKKQLGIMVCLFCLFVFFAAADESPSEEQLHSVTKHSVTIGGKVIGYTVTTGTMPLCDDKGEQDAYIFYIAYTRDDVEDKTKRPIMFSFNGGPGSSSVWMHMGFLGPRRVLYNTDGFMLQPPYEVIDNEYSILDVADLVFIDPVATGFSRMFPKLPPHKYHGVMEDIQSVAEFIRLYVTRNDRWGSPKFIIGESYGTTRAAGLTGYLLRAHNMYTNGTILVSMTELGPDPPLDVSCMLILPHFTATAWYHKVLPPDLQAKPLREVLDEAEAFALGEYALALNKGGWLSDTERAGIASKISRFTGLSAAFIKNCNLRVERHRFWKELLRSRGLTVGRLDSRYTGTDIDSAGETFEFDPAMAHWNGPFTGAVNRYFKKELEISTDLNYNIFGSVSPWKGRRDVNTGQMLRQAMTANPFLKVFILEGYYDGACDYFTAQYTMSHLDLSGKLKDRISFGFYESGHMMYIHLPSLMKAKQDLADFIRSACPER
jgi:carboxypeptidase C (cathepsin A)